MGFFYGENMADVKKPGPKTPKGKPKEKGPQDPGAQPEKVSPQSLVRKAYRKVNEQLDDKTRSSKAIDDLVKLLKAQKDLGGEKKPVKEVKVRWETSEDESSSEG